MRQPIAWLPDGATAFAVAGATWKTVGYARPQSGLAPPTAIHGVSLRDTDCGFEAGEESLVLTGSQATPERDIFFFGNVVTNGRDL